MGVLNTTPDSFSDGGALYRDGVLASDAALRRAAQMFAEGAAIIDVGGESTRPGATPVSLQQELDRVVPVVARLCAELDVVVSVDTSSPAVMREAVAAGAGLINDVRALRRDGALAAAAELAVPVCLMHMQGEPGNMQQSPEYGDVVAEVLAFFAERVAACSENGITTDRIILDPGFGFGKSLDHNLTLLRQLPRLRAPGLPLLVGLSRKSMIAKLLERDVDQRLPASIALATLAVDRGARIVRAHDVSATNDALAMVAALQE